MKIIGILLLGTGVLASLIGFNMDATYGGVYNVGLLNDRQNLIILGGVLLIIGSIFIGFSSIRNNSEKSQNSDTRKCPYCAEFVKKEAVVCRYCQKELPPISEPALNDAVAQSLAAELGYQGFKPALNDAVTQSSEAKKRFIMWFLSVVGILFLVVGIIFRNAEFFLGMGLLFVVTAVVFFYGIKKAELPDITLADTQNGNDLSSVDAKQKPAVNEKYELKRPHRAAENGDPITQNDLRKH